MARAASSSSRDWLSTSGPFGSCNTAMIDALGTNSCSIPSNLASNGVTEKTTPVILPPGRLMLATRPTLAGSAPMTNTIGVAAVAALPACAAGTPAPTITATCLRMRSAASPGSRSSWPFSGLSLARIWSAPARGGRRASHLAECGQRNRPHLYIGQSNLDHTRAIRLPLRKNDMHRLTAVDGLQRGLLLPRDTAPIARLQGQISASC